MGLRPMLTLGAPPPNPRSMSGARYGYRAPHRPDEPTLCLLDCYLLGMRPVGTRRPCPESRACAYRGKPNAGTCRGLPPRRTREVVRVFHHFLAVVVSVVPDTIPKHCRASGADPMDLPRLQARHRFHSPQSSCANRLEQRPIRNHLAKVAVPSKFASPEMMRSPFVRSDQVNGVLFSASTCIFPLGLGRKLNLMLDSANVNLSDPIGKAPSVVPSHIDYWVRCNISTIRIKLTTSSV